MKPARTNWTWLWMGCVGLGLVSGCSGDLGAASTTSTVLCTLRACYADRDGDGVGAGAPVDACVCAPGFTEVGGDCDDGNAARWQTLGCHPDGDGDHYGAGAAATVCVGLTCADGGSGWAESAGDCNDADATVHPNTVERYGNGVDEDCDGAIDEAAVTYAVPIYWITSAPATRAAASDTAGSAFTVALTLNQPAEIDAAADGKLFARVYHRKLSESSLPYQVGPLTRVDVWAGVTVDDLEPFTAYEARVDLYRLVVSSPLPTPQLQFSRIAPANGCSGDASSDVPCSNSDVYYTVTPPDGDNPVQAMRHAVLLAALHERDQFPYEDLGNWDDSLRNRYLLARRDAHWSSELYAWSGMPFLRDLNPCRAGSATAPIYCPADATSPAENSVARLVTWFSAYPGAFVKLAGQVDFTRLRAGDWLAVDATADSPDGSQSRMFLAWDAAAGRYWFIEGDGTSANAWGSIRHLVRVGSDARIDRVASLGRLDNTAMAR